MRWTLLFVLAMSYLQDCNLRLTSDTTRISGALVDFHTGDTVQQSAKLFINHKVSNPFEPDRYTPWRAFYAASDGTFSVRFRHQPGNDYYLSLPPGEHFGYALPQYSRIRKGRNNFVEIRVKPIRRIIQVGISCRHSHPDGIRLQSSITIPYESPQRLLYDEYFLLGRPDTTVLLPGVPGEPHRVTASAYYSLQDTTVIWSHALQVPEDTIYIDFDF